MRKGIIRINKEKPKVIVIDTVANDDWMKALPGYKKEVQLHEELAKKFAEMKSKRKG